MAASLPVQRRLEGTSDSVPGVVFTTTKIAAATSSFHSSEATSTTSASGRIVAGASMRCAGDVWTVVEGIASLGSACLRFVVKHGLPCYRTHAARACEGRGTGTNERTPAEHPGQRDHGAVISSAVHRDAKLDRTGARIIFDREPMAWVARALRCRTFGGMVG